MRKQECFDYSRRALLGASGALALLAALRPLRTFAQASDGKLRIGIIGSGHIGGAIGGLWVKAGHPVLFSSRHPDPSQAKVRSTTHRRDSGLKVPKVWDRVTISKPSPCQGFRGKRSLRIWWPGSVHSPNMVRC